MTKLTRRLVIQHLENVSSDILEKHPEIIRDYIKGQNGIYALYDEDKLYYVGLATDLRNRLKQHLGDRHSGLWNRFSLYLTKGDEHLRELESLVLRIASPKGNVLKTRFAGSSNLALDLEKRIKIKSDQEIAKIFGRSAKVRETALNSSPFRNARNRSQSALAPYITKGFPIRHDYKGKRYIAKVHANGKIHFNGKVFTSASMAGAEIMRGHSVNGWTFWKYQNSQGEWVLLDELRKKRPRPRPFKIERKRRVAALAPYVRKSFPIQANYKGKLYTAKVHPDGTITYNGKLFTSPSLAGSAVRNGKQTGGWHFWKYQDEKGEWKKLDVLRR